MGSICHIRTDPKTWSVYLTSFTTRPEFGSVPLKRIEYGEFDDDPGGAFLLSSYMRAPILEKLLAGTYSVSPDSRYLRRLIILDENVKYVEPLGASVY